MLMRLCCDPIALLMEVINGLHPDLNVVVQWSSQLSAAEGCMTVPGGDGRPWFIMLSTKLPMEAVVFGVVGGAAQAITGEMETPAWKASCGEIIERCVAKQEKHKHASELWGDSPTEIH